MIIHLLFSWPPRWERPFIFRIVQDLPWLVETLSGWASPLSINLSLCKTKSLRSSENLSGKWVFWGSILYRIQPMFLCLHIGGSIKTRNNWKWSVFCVLISHISVMDTKRWFLKISVLEVNQYIPESQHDTAELRICVSLWKNTFCTVPFGKERGQDMPENHNK